MQDTKSEEAMKRRLISMRTSQTSLRSVVDLQNGLIEGFLRNMSSGDEEATESIMTEAFEAMKQSTERIQGQLNRERAEDELLAKIVELEKQVHFMFFHRCGWLLCWN